MVQLASLPNMTIEPSKLAEADIILLQFDRLLKPKS